jgi:hypothetical protein
MIDEEETQVVRHPTGDKAIVLMGKQPPSSREFLNL